MKKQCSGRCVEITVAKGEITDNAFLGYLSEGRTGLCACSVREDAKHSVISFVSPNNGFFASRSLNLQSEQFRVLCRQLSFVMGEMDSAGFDCRGMMLEKDCVFFDGADFIFIVLPMPVIKPGINIACPVDAVVSYNGEQLSSVAAAVSGTSKASFGTVQLLGKNKDIKVFSLDPGKDYDVDLTGTGEGTMDYLVNYFDENDNLTDYRSFTSVPVASTTVMKSTTATTTVTTLEIDFDGDGVFESNLQVGKNSEPVNPNPVPATTAPVVQKPEEPEIPENNGSQMEGWTIVLIVLAIVFIVGGIVTVIVLTTNSSMKKAREPKAVVPPVGFYNNENKEISLDSAASSGEISADASEQSVYSEPPETEALNSSNGHICISWDYPDVNCKGEKSFTISDGKNMIIGKYPSVTDAELPKECRNVSRMHCTISYNAQRNEYYVVDSSTNGTYFASKSYGNYNIGQRLQKGKRTCVNAGSYIALANTKCVVHLM